MHKSSKIYLNNTNLSHCLSIEKPNKGTLRETFFFNQLRLFHRINFPKQGDFIVDDSYTFEIGGKNKSKYQIKDISLIQYWHLMTLKQDLETKFPYGCLVFSISM